MPLHSIVLPVGLLRDLDLILIMYRLSLPIQIVTTLRLDHVGMHILCGNPGASKILQLPSDLIMASHM